ncbi:cytochrome P450 [Microbacterium sp. X-17]|uniref:cytochrome P450 n=1 Tax=Microbacterium sp. X-17 TaxID=3144404 RepID=UPI0031F54492
MSTTTDIGEGAPTDSGQLFDLEPAAIRCPFRIYDKLRTDEPVYWEPRIEAFVVSRYDDIVAITGQPNLFSNGVQNSPVHDRRVQEVAGALFGEAPEIFERAGQLRGPAGFLLNADPPEHARQRALVNRAFTLRQVRKMEEGLTELVDRLLDGFDASGDVEIVRDFAVPLPVTVIANALGVEIDHTADVKRWSDDFLKMLNPHLTTVDMKDALGSQIEFYTYFREQIADRRQNPKEDLLTALVEANIDGEALTEPEILEASLQVMAAGNDTTTKIITAMVLRLARDPQLAARLRAEPDLVSDFVEEVLRLESPGQGFYRIATADTEVAGVAIPQGSVLFLLYASGSRDESRFENAEELVFGRDVTTPHLSFGQGEHFCVGATLARAELRIAIQRLLERFSDISTPLADEDIEYISSYQFRGIESLPVHVTRAE